LWYIPQNNYEKKDTFVILIEKSSMKRDKNIKITPQTHKLLKEYCEKNGLKMFAFVEKLIREKCKPKTDIYGDEFS
jgi:predicted DNA-binding protein (UPF0278 family)